MSATCCADVASSADLSSRIRIKRGKRKEIPFSGSTCEIKQKHYNSIVNFRTKISQRINCRTMPFAA